MFNWDYFVIPKRNQNVAKKRLKRRERNLIELFELKLFQKIIPTNYFLVCR